MRKLSIALVFIAALALSACGGSDDATDTGDSDTTEARVFSPTQLTNAYGEIAGTCIGSEFTGEGLEYEEREQMRMYLHQIIDTAEADPDAKSSDGQTANEILFDLVPTLKDCDQALALEAEAAATK